MTENLDANEVRREVVRTAVGELRTKLLDLTGRNRLLNFRHAERGRQVRIVGADLLGIYAQLITGTPIELRPLPEPSREYNENEDVAAELEVLRDNDAIYLASIEAAEDDSKLLAEAEAELARRHGIKATRHKSVVVDVARAAGIDPGFDLEIGTQTESRTRTKSSLQTLLLPDVYDRRLSQVRDDARSALQELGINTLNCTLSFLEWYEDDNSRKVILSPLVLVPLAIDRVVERSKYVYRVNGIGEDAETNVTLAERLRRDFSILLPKYDVDQTLDTYLDLIRDAIKDKPTWQIRNFATISTLNFARLSIYADLDSEASSSDNAFEDHPIVSALLAGAEERTGETAPSALPDEAFQLSLTPALITDADSSQYAAIIEAARGKNLVIEGPPGTGKSQTITNVIAAALEMGKTVLFVAEKAAALEVVKSRLDAAGLGAFCLEMHSTKARKADVHAAIQRRLRLALSPEGDPQTAFKSTEREAEILSGYSSELNSTVGASNASLHTTVWRQERLRQEIGEDMALHFESTRVDEVSAIEPHVLSTMIETVVAWRDRRKALASVWGDVDRYPLVFVAAPHMNDRELRALTSVVEDCVEKSIAVSAALVTFERVFGALSGKSIDDLISTFMIFSKLQHLTGAPKSVVQCLEAKVDHTIIAEWVADRAAIEDSLASYGTSVVVAGESQLSTLARIRTLAEARSLADEISLSEVRRLLSADQQELQRLRELFLDNEAA